MKDIYMEVVQENGLLPEDFNLSEYLHKKRLENEEWQKTTELEKLQGRKNSGHDEKLDEDYCIN